MKNIILNLQTLVLPKIVKEALALYGTKEFKGLESNPIIINWAAELGIIYYSNDSISWCGLFLAVCVKRAKYTVVKDPLAAKNWLNFGTKVDSPELGDIIIFTRDGGNHVAIYTGENENNYFVLGGNQSDDVNIMAYGKHRAIGFRRPPYKIKPASVKKYYYA